MEETKRIVPAKEHVYLEGPKSRGYEFLFAIKVLLQFIRGFRNLHFIGPCITVFGSARFPENHPYYAMAREVGMNLAKAGFTVMTGGGPSKRSDSKLSASGHGGFSENSAYH